MILTVSHSVMSDVLRSHGLFVARQAPLFMEFSRQEYWSGLPFLFPGELLNPEIEPGSPECVTPSLKLDQEVQPSLQCQGSNSRHLWERGRLVMKAPLKSNRRRCCLLLPLNFRSRRRFTHQSPRLSVRGFLDHRPSNFWRPCWPAVVPALEKYKLTDLGNGFSVAEGKDEGEGIGKQFGMEMYTMLHLKRITNKDLLYSTWNTAQCYVAA